MIVNKQYSIFNSSDPTVFFYCQSFFMCMEKVRSFVTTRTMGAIDVYISQFRIFFPLVHIKPGVKSTVSGVLCI